jgi:hypothetical protein
MQLFHLVLSSNLRVSSDCFPIRMSRCTWDLLPARRAILVELECRQMWCSPGHVGGECEVVLGACGDNIILLWGHSPTRVCPGQGLRAGKPRSACPTCEFSIVDKPLVGEFLKEATFLHLADVEVELMGTCSAYCGQQLPLWPHTGHCTSTLCMCVCEWALLCIQVSFWELFYLEHTWAFCCFLVFLCLLNKPKEPKTAYHGIK